MEEDLRNPAVESAAPAPKTPSEMAAERNGETNGKGKVIYADSDEYEQMKLRQRMPFALVAGLAAAVVCAALWAAITALAQVQIGWMAILIGIAVGYTVRAAGRAVQPTFGILAAGLSLFGCLSGNFLSVFVYAARSEGISFWTLLSEFDYAYAPQLMADTFGMMDILFYALAIVEGYKLGYKRIEVRYSRGR